MGRIWIRRSSGGRIIYVEAVGLFMFIPGSYRQQRAWACRLVSCQLFYWDIVPSSAAMHCNVAIVVSGMIQLWSGLTSSS